MLANKLLSYHLKDVRRKKEIISFICSGSGSHDYTINRREAKDRLRLPVFKPSEEQYNLIKQIYIDIVEELQLNNPFNPNVILGANQTGNYVSKRCILESIKGGSKKFITDGNLIKKANPQTGEFQIQNVISFEGWKDDY